MENFFAPGIQKVIYLNVNKKPVMSFMNVSKHIRIRTFLLLFEGKYLQFAQKNVKSQEDLFVEKFN